jgi:O-antigen/teichoic acid export membrane protein
MSERRATLTSGRTLARNSVWHFLGESVPLVVAVVALPFVIKGLGVERYGALGIAWGVIGYFALFDLGIGRALTREISVMLASRREEEIPETTVTALAILGALGLIGVAFLLLLVPWLVRDVLRIPAALQDEMRMTLQLLALMLPVILITAGSQGVLVAHQRFDILSAIRIPLGAFTFASPLLVLPFSTTLPGMVTALLVARVLTMLVVLFVSFRMMPALRGVRFRLARLRPLLHIGGWMTVSNIVGPLMVYLDRFIIGSVLSMSAVAFYVTPYEIVTKLWLIPAVLTGTLFPAFAGAAADTKHLARLYERGLSYVTMVLFPVVLVITVFSVEGVDMWLGPRFAGESATVLQWLALGVFFNSVAHVPFAMIQAVGRPDLTAKLHVVELPFYLLACIWLISGWGILGAAIAWSARAIVDGILLLWLATRHLPGLPMSHGRLVVVWLGATLAWCAALWPSSLLLKLGFVTVVLIVFAVISWHVIMDQSERAMLQNILRGLRPGRTGK